MQVVDIASYSPVRPLAPHGLFARRPLPRRSLRAARTVIAIVVSAVALSTVPSANAVPDPEIEYSYNATVRRHYNFPGNDPVGYGHQICDKLGSGLGYGQLMSDVQREVEPSDVFAANFVVGNAVNLLCPDLIWQLRQSAGGYRPPDGSNPAGTYY